MHHRLAPETLMRLWSNHPTICLCNCEVTSLKPGWYDTAHHMSGQCAARIGWLVLVRAHFEGDNHEKPK